MLLTYKDIPEQNEIEAAIAWADVLAAGPGIGKGSAAKQILSQMLIQKEKQMVLDADALNLIAENDDLKDAVRKYQKNRLVMTPHPGELIRLAQSRMQEYYDNPAGMVKNVSEDFGCVLAGKDAVTLIAESGNETLFMNLTGNDGMATAGSGDVLCGIISGFLAQGLSSVKAAVIGVYLHGKAGDEAAKIRSRYGMKASDITECLWQGFDR